MTKSEADSFISNKSPAIDQQRVIVFDPTPTASDPSANFIRDPTSLIADTLNVFLFTSSCDSVLSTAAKVGSGVTLPVATITASFRGAYQTSGNAIQILRGSVFRLAFAGYA